MSFISILFLNKNDKQNLPADTPQYFNDLNLDQIIDEITAGWEEFNLKPFFYFPLNNSNEIHYRHQVFKELENENLYEQVKLFAERMQKVKQYLKLIEKFYYTQQKEIWFLYAADIYSDSIMKFKDFLSSVKINSEGFKKNNDYLIEYCRSNYFNSIKDEIKNITTELSQVKYQIIIQEGAFTVQNYEEGIDYSSEIEKTFEKFKQGNVKDSSNNELRNESEYVSAPTEMNHIEAKILEFVSLLYPNVFSRLKNFYNSYTNFLDKTIAEYDREIPFYISYLEHIKKFKQNGLKFCYPEISNPTKEIYNYEGFDLALAQKLNTENKQIVCNDFYLEDKERIIVVTGPNQGGKTTFARMFGQVHYLGSLGCPVPGTKAKLFLYDNIFTQFERIEKVENLRGKLEDDLKRIYSILNSASSNSIILLNEIFNSTTLQDMKFLSTKILERITELDAICVLVTFVEELSNFNEKTVSMTSMIDPENSSLRTYKILRRPADGLAYAMAIADKYKLKDYEIKERLIK